MSYYDNKCQIFLKNGNNFTITYTKHFFLKTTTLAVLSNSINQIRILVSGKYHYFHQNITCFSQFLINPLRVHEFKFIQEFDYSLQMHASTLDGIYYMHLWHIVWFMKRHKKLTSYVKTLFHLKVTSTLHYNKFEKKMF